MDPVMIMTAISALAGAKQAFDPEGGGGGGNVSSQTKAGSSDIEFTPVGGEALEITPFDYLQQVMEEQEAPIPAYMGRPLYANSGEPITITARDYKTQIAQDIFGDRIKQFMPQGLLGLLIAKNYLDNTDEGEEESIVPMPAYMGRPLYANQGMEIEDVVVTAPPLDPPLDPPSYELEPLEPGDPELGPPAFDDLKGELDEILAAQRRQDIFKGITEGIGTLSELKKTIDPETGKPIKGRGSIVPVVGGGRANRQKRQRTVGITPFTYRPTPLQVNTGGALNRAMFMQNYMPHGGEMQGPGGPKDDLIPVMASDGEYMLSKAAVDQAGGGNHAKGIARLEQFNRLGNRRYG